MSNECSMALVLELDGETVKGLLRPDADEDVRDAANRGHCALLDDEVLDEELRPAIKEGLAAVHTRLLEQRFGKVTFRDYKQYEWSGETRLLPYVTIDGQDRPFEQFSVGVTGQDDNRGGTGPVVGVRITADPYAGGLRDSPTVWADWREPLGSTVRIDAELLATVDEARRLLALVVPALADAPLVAVSGWWTE